AMEERMGVSAMALHQAREAAQHEQRVYALAQIVTLAFEKGANERRVAASPTRRG
ncbi:unnamed protein product, partial [Durusdinium trenchii]